MNIQMIPRRKFAGLIYRKSHSAIKPSLACVGRWNRNSGVGIMATRNRTEDERLLIWFAVAATIIVVLAAALVILPMPR